MGLLNGVLLARMLGPAEFGVYSIAIAAVTLLGTLAALGLPPLVTREVAIHQAQENWPLLKGLLATSQLWVLLASLFFVAVGGALVLLDRFPATLTLMGRVSILVLVPLIALNLLRAGILRGLHSVLAADVPDLLLRPLAVFMMLGGVYAFALEMNAGSALLIQTGAALLALGFGSWLLTRRLPEPARQTTLETTHRQWLRSSGIFLAITIVGMLEGQVPLYLLGHLAGPEQAGLYQAANQIVGVVAMGLVAINMPLQPKLAAAWVKGGKEQAQKLVADASRLSAAVAFVSAFTLLLFAEWVLGIYGAAYVEAAGALRILAVGQFINAVSGPCGFVLVATGNQKIALYGIATGLLVATTIIWFLAPPYGLVGAALGAMLGTLTWNALMAYWAWKTVAIRTFFH